MAYPRYYPETYGSIPGVRFEKTIEIMSSIFSNFSWVNVYPKTIGSIISHTTTFTKRIEKMIYHKYGLFLRTYGLSYPASYPKFRDVYNDILKMVVGSNVDRSVSKQTRSVVNGTSIRSFGVSRFFSQLSSITSTKISNVSKGVYGYCSSYITTQKTISRFINSLCNALPNYSGVRIYLKILSATSSSIVWIEQYIFTWAKQIESVCVSSMLLFQREISRTINCVVMETVFVSRGIFKTMDTLTNIVTTVPRLVSKTNISNIVSFSKISRASRIFVVSEVFSVSSITKKTLKVVSGYVVGIGTTVKIFITGFVKKMFTYPADPEFKVEEDE